MGREALACGQVGRVEILSKQFAQRLVLGVSKDPALQTIFCRLTCDPCERKLKLWAQRFDLEVSRDLTRRKRPSRLTQS